jgi:hypothetical protein
MVYSIPFGMIVRAYMGFVKRFQILAHFRFSLQIDRKIGLGNDVLESDFPVQV